MANANELKKGIVVVEFIKSWTPYVTGEIAGFDKDIAKQLVKKNIAVLYKKSK